MKREVRRFIDFSLGGDKVGDGENKNKHDKRDASDHAIVELGQGNGAGVLPLDKLGLHEDQHEKGGHGCEQGREKRGV